MAIINVPNTFSANTTISSSEVNANFSTIYNEFNGSIAAANLSSDSVTTTKIADSAVTTAKIADSAVTPAKLQSGTGSTWAWQSWSPTLANLSGGTTVANYNQVGKTVSFRFRYTLAGAGVGTNPSFTLPVASTGYYVATDSPIPFHAATYDASAVTILPLTTFMTSASVVRLLAYTAGGTYAGVTNVTSAIPTTWATGDVIFVHGSYEAA